MYFRNTNEKTWAEVIHNLGNQPIHGNLTVGGNINAKEITVTSNTGADIVFEPDYPFNEDVLQEDRQVCTQGKILNHFFICKTMRDHCAFPVIRMFHIIFLVKDDLDFINSILPASDLKIIHQYLGEDDT